MFRLPIDVYKCLAYKTVSLLRIKFCEVWKFKSFRKMLRYFCKFGMKIFIDSGLDPDRMGVGLEFINKVK
jgi:hypothetical protein